MLSKLLEILVVIAIQQDKFYNPPMYNEKVADKILPQEDDDEKFVPWRDRPLSYFDNDDDE